MKETRLKTWYYQQFDANYSLDVPAEGYGGWKQAMLPLELEKTAIVVMHAWDCGKQTDYPGWYRAVEYIERANKISETVFPFLLEKAREKSVNIIHVTDNSGYADMFEGAIKTRALCKKYFGDSTNNHYEVSSSAIHSYLGNFKRDFSFPGKNNIPDIDRGQAAKGFMKGALPNDNEYIAADSNQLHSVCLELGINHLIYIGFAINWCLQYSPGNMNDMADRGLLCSTIREAVTAVENKSSAKNETNKDYALWVTALKNGFVYDYIDFMNCLEKY